MKLKDLGVFLEDRARQGKTTYYSEVVAAFGLPPLGNNWNGHPLKDALDELYREDADAGRP